MRNVYKYRDYYIDSIIIFIIVGGFFLNLFYPKQQIFVTPDIGQSDILDLNIPAKYSLAQSLSKNELPLWNDSIGNGFPQLAEGQIGSLNIMNIVIFKFFPFPFSYNISQVIIFFTTALGTYLFLRQISITRQIALFCGLSFAFSGFFVNHITHFNLIQAAAYFPWIMILTNILIGYKRTLLMILLMSLVFTQQLFSGHPQTTFISILASFSYSAIKLYVAKNNFNFIYKLLICYISIGILFVALASVHFLPSSEFLQISNRDGGHSQIDSTRYSFDLKNLLNFIHPYINGDPRIGNYLPFYEDQGNIFWENNGYFGPIIIISLFLFVLYFKELIHNKKNLLPAVALILISFFLMLGKYSPFLFIYSFPPFSYFRVPSRFLFVFIWGLISFSAIVLNYIYGKYFSTNTYIPLVAQFAKKNEQMKHTNRYADSNLNTYRYSIKFKYLIYGSMVASLSWLFYFSYNYNLTGNADAWLSTPRFADHTSKSDDRVFVTGTPLVWNTVFLDHGWKNLEKKYLFLRNGLGANSNLLYDINSFGVYPILVTRRYQLYDELVNEGLILYNPDKLEITNTTIKLLSASNVRYIITGQKVNSNEINLVESITDESLKLNLYEIPTVLPRARIINNYIVAKTVKELKTIVKSDRFNFAETTILEDIYNLPPPNESHDPYSIEWLSDENTKISMNIVTTRESILVLADTYYPGWKAYIDDVETEIYPANINQRAIVVPEGEHIFVLNTNRIHLNTAQLYPC